MDEVLRCDPRSFGLAGVVQLLVAQRLVGTLWLDRAGSPVGMVMLAGGKVVGARCGAVSGRAGFYDLFLVTTTTARFVVREPSTDLSPDPLGDPLRLVMEGCRLKDEWMRLAACQWQGPDAAVPADLSPTLRELLQLVREGSTVADALGRLGGSPSEVVDGLRDLLHAGVLAPGEASSAPELAPMSFQETLEAGRRYYQLGMLTQAVTAFRAALDLRPDDAVAKQNLEHILQLHPEIAPLTQTRRSHALDQG